jgi:hypothetical protein
MFGCQKKLVIFAHNTPQYLNLKLLAGLTNKFTHPLSKVSFQHMITILGYPDKIVLYLKLYMTSLAVFHANDYNPIASRMLPTSKAVGF